jgi:hypothetical protein
MRTVLSKGVLATLALILALGSIACDDDSTGPEVYSEPFSVEITAVGDILMASDTRALTTATVFLPSGVNETVEFVFLNRDGTLVEPSSGEFLEISIANESIGSWTPDQTGGFTGTLRGLAPGSTRLLVRYMYDGVGSSNAKASFVSAPLTFTVQ